MPYLNLKELRTNRGWTQLQLAVEAQVGLETVRRFETSESREEIDTLTVGSARKIAEALGVTLNHLFCAC